LAVCQLPCTIIAYRGESWGQLPCLCAPRLLTNQSSMSKISMRNVPLLPLLTEAQYKKKREREQVRHTLQLGLIELQRYCHEVSTGERVPTPNEKRVFVKLRKSIEKLLKQQK